MAWQIFKISEEKIKMHNVGDIRRRKNEVATADNTLRNTQYELEKIQVKGK